MRRGGLAYARSRAQASLLLVLVASFALVGLDALNRSAEQRAVDAALRAGPPTAGIVKVEVAADQEGDLGKRLDRAPADIVRSVRAEGFPARHDASTVSLLARADPGLAARSVLTDGRWPIESPSGDEIHAALQVRAAEALGITVGDRLTVGSGADTVDVVVDGLWRPRDAAATAWAGDPAVASGRGPGGWGPLAVSASDLSRLPAQAVTSYVLAPRSSDDLAGLGRALKKLTTELDEGDAAVSVSGGLRQRLADLETTRKAGDGLLAVAYTLVGIAAFVACQQVLSLLTEARRTETTLLRSRGETLAALVRSATLEAFVAATVGAGLGTGASVVLFSATDHAPSHAVAVLVALACIGVTAGLAGVATWASARSAAVSRSVPRDALGTRVVVLVLALAAAALSVGQFLAYDGPLSSTPSGGTRVDPLTSIAPAASLTALALLGSTLAGPLLRVVEGVTARSPGLTPAFPARRLARKLSTFGVAIVLVSLATGFAVMAAALAATQSSVDDRAARMRSGADARLDLSVDRYADVGAESATRPLIDLGDRSIAVMAVPGRVDEEQLSFLAAPSALPKVAAASRGSADSGRITGLLKGTAVGIPVGAGAIDVGVRLRGTITDGEVTAKLWLVDRAGQVAVRPLEPVPYREIRGGPVARTFTVPADRHGWRAVAVEARAAGITGDATIEFSGLPGAAHHDVVLTNGLTEGRAPIGFAPKTLPVVVTPAVADLINAGRGDTFDLLLPDSGFNASVKIARVVPAIPGVSTSRGVAADLPTFVAYALVSGEDLPASNSVWVATHDPEKIARDAASSSIVPVTATTSAKALSSRIVDSAVDTWWWAAATVIVFAALATAAMTASLVQARRGELQVLRALGVPAGRQSGIATSELAGAIGVGLVVGLVAGGITAAMTIATLSRSASPGLPAAVGPRLSLLLPGLLGLAALLGLALIGVAVSYARRIRREAVRTGWKQVT